MVIHPLTDHRRTLPLDKKGEVVAAHPDFQLVISYNPGYQSLMKDLKPSTKQRFAAFDFDYPEPVLEAEIVARETGIDADTAARLVKLAQAAQPEEPRSLRRHIHALGRLCRSAILRGIAPRAACRTAMVRPITDDADIRETLDHAIDAIFA